MTNFNLYGPVNDFGYGIFTKGIINGLTELGESDFYLHPIGGIRLEDQGEAQILNSFAQRNMWSRSAPSVAVWHEFDLDKFSSNKLIAYPIFETTKFNPRAMNYLKQMDAICALSNWAKNIIIENIGNDVPVHVVPGASDEVSLTLEEESRIVKSNAFTFFSIGKFEARKSSLEIVKAYVDAFESVKSDTRLILHCFNPFDKEFVPRMTSLLRDALGLKIVPSTLTDSIIAVKGGAIVEIPKSRMTRTEIYQLIKASHAGVFPSRAEGWNLPLMEAVKAGVPCIATDYSAHTEYLNSETGYPSELLLTKLTTEVAQDGIFFHGDRGDWKKPEVTEISEKMSYIHSNYSEVKSKLNVDKIKENFTWKNTAEKLVEVINSVND